MSQNDAEVYAGIVEELVFMWERKRGVAGSCDNFVLFYIVWKEIYLLFVWTHAQSDQLKCTWYLVVLH